jgi:hypothetical protein
MSTSAESGAMIADCRGESKELPIDQDPRKSNCGGSGGPQRSIIGLSKERDES